MDELKPEGEAAAHAPAGNVLHVRVPASTSNIGPGFDCLGWALDLHNDYIVRPLDEDEENRLAGGEAPGGRALAGHPFFAAVRDVYERLGSKPPALELEIETRVPVGGGLGSSGAARIAGALAANHLLGQPLRHEDLLTILIEREGHPDNVTPSLYGGLTLTARTEDGPLVHLYQPAECWRLALLVPGYPLSTEKMRRALPRKVRLEDAVFNLSRLPLLIDALVAGDAAEVRRVLEDRLHEPVRLPWIKRQRRLREAAMAAGATAVSVSGAGPTLAALCEGDEAAAAVGEAMMAEVADARFESQLLIARTEPAGATVED